MLLVSSSPACNGCPSGDASHCSRCLTASGNLLVACNWLFLPLVMLVVALAVSPLHRIRPLSTGPFTSLRRSVPLPGAAEAASAAAQLQHAIVKAQLQRGHSGHWEAVDEASYRMTQALHSGVDASMDHSSQASRTTSSNVAQGTVLGIVWTTSLVFGVMYVAVGRLWPRYWRGNEEVASFRSNPLQLKTVSCSLISQVLPTSFHQSRLPRSPRALFDPNADSTGEPPGAKSDADAAPRGQTFPVNSPRPAKPLVLDTYGTLWASGTQQSSATSNRRAVMPGGPVKTHSGPRAGSTAAGPWAPFAGVAPGPLLSQQEFMMAMREEMLYPSLQHLLPGQVIMVMRALRLRGAWLGPEAHAAAANTIQRLGQMHADVFTLAAVGLEGIFGSDNALMKPAKSDIVAAFGDLVLTYVEDVQRMTAAEAMMTCVADEETQALSEEQYTLVMSLLTKNSSSAPSMIIFLAKRLDLVQGIVQRVATLQQLLTLTDGGRPAGADPDWAELTAAEKHSAHMALNVWAHLCNAMGLNQFKSDFEDMAFRLLHPEEHAAIHEALDTSGRKCERVLEDCTEALKRDLRSDAALMAEIEGYAITGRTKSPYSVWRKMQKKGLTVDEVLDKVALRIVIDVQEVCDLMQEDTGQCKLRGARVCYAAREKVRALWPTLVDKDKDYVANPKPNGYQSLHIIALKTAADGQELPVEIQIRDAFMDRQAEFGVAGHWQYKMANHKLNAKHLKDACQQLFNEIDEDGSGAIDEAELSQLLRRLGAPVSDHEIESVMRIFDIDGNGTIDFEEFWTALHTTWFSVLSGDIGKSHILA